MNLMHPTQRLAFLVIASILMLSIVGCDNEKDETPSTPSGPPLAPNQQPQFPPTVVQAPRPSPAPSLQCLTEDGIPKKVLIVERGLRGLDAPGGQLAGKPPLRFYWPYYVFDQTPPDRPLNYLIGPSARRTRDLVWVPSAMTAPWNTRTAKKLVSKIPVLVYEHPESLTELLTTGKTDAKPIARARSGEGWMPWPVAASRTVTANGRAHELAQLHFLGELRNTTHAASYSQAKRQQIESSVRKIDLMFVRDDTISTKPFQAAFKRFTAELTNKLQGMSFQPDLAVGVVRYRDYVGSIMYTTPAGKAAVTRVDLTADLAGFLRDLEAQHCATSHSEELSEAVYDGVHEGLSASWRGDSLSHRILVLLGDNSAHPQESPKNPQHIGPQQLIDQAKRKKVKIIGVSVDGQGDAEEYAIRRAQWLELAQGTGGESFLLTNDPDRVADEVVACLHRMFEAEAAVVEDRTVIVHKLLEGETVEEIKSELDDVRRLTNVMEFLQQAGIEISRLEPGVPTFASGWCLCEVGGEEVLETVVLISRAELDLLLAELTELMRRTGPNFPRNLLIQATDTRLGFLTEPRPESMDVYLAARGIPCPNGILMVSQDQLQSMSEEQRAELHEHLARRLIPGLLNFRNDTRNFVLLNELDIAWIPATLLP